MKDKDEDEEKIERMTDKDDMVECRRDGSESRLCLNYFLADFSHLGTAKLSV